MISFFTDSSKNFLDDDAFYKLDNVSGSGPSTNADSFKLGAQKEEPAFSEKIQEEPLN